MHNYIKNIYKLILIGTEIAYPGKAFSNTLLAARRAFQSSLWQNMRVYGRTCEFMVGRGQGKRGATACVFKATPGRAGHWTDQKERRCTSTAQKKSSDRAVTLHSTAKKSQATGLWHCIRLPKKVKRQGCDIAFDCQKKSSDRAVTLHSTDQKKSSDRAVTLHSTAKKKSSTGLWHCIRLPKKSQATGQWHCIRLPKKVNRQGCDIAFDCQKKSSDRAVTLHSTAQKSQATGLWHCIRLPKKS